MLNVKITWFIIFRNSFPMCIHKPWPLQLVCLSWRQQFAICNHIKCFYGIVSSSCNLENGYIYKVFPTGLNSVSITLSNSISEIDITANPVILFQLLTPKCDLLRPYCRCFGTACIDLQFLLSYLRYQTELPFFPSLIVF